LKGDPDAYLEAATQRTSFFEKIAIGSGATIAALVSFLGTHAAGLHPHWVLRCSLVSLAIAMVSALYRNYMYPHYQVSANARQFYAATRNVAEEHNALFQPPRIRAHRNNGSDDGERAKTRESSVAQSQMG
jgi:hypothetical protein